MRGSCFVAISGDTAGDSDVVAIGFEVKSGKDEEATNNFSAISV